MTDTKEIVFHVAGRSISVELPAEEVDTMQSIIGEVNEVFHGFKKDYPTKDKIDQVIMAFMQILYKEVHENQGELKELRLQIQTINSILPEDL
jgi:cell division protein ZapA (FtsZ GTPase activity inhibitor)